ncbi:MAG TPA: 30S ribosomal protein S12 methylthiotransferase RimO [Vicinamibacterales bacterium]|nr:30S ribosomal protein S12 methylthiotransferase RimO [Vicinamibacterales bacterium]
MKIGFVSLGCPKNLVDSEVMLGLAEQAGHVVTAEADGADVLVVNTCAFIDRAKQESIDTILEMAELKKQARGRRLVVTGCLAERYREELRKEIPEIDAVLGTGEVGDFVAAVSGASSVSGPESPKGGPDDLSGEEKDPSGPSAQPLRFYKRDPIQAAGVGPNARQSREREVPSRSGEAASRSGAALSRQPAAPVFGLDLPTYIYDADTPRRRATPAHYAYVKIAEGCDYKCAFCIIPKMRGHYRSRTVESIVAEARRLAAEGVRELLLISQDTTFYGIDRGERGSLPRLLRALNEVEGLDWIRMLYLYPTTITDEVIDAVAELDKVCKYIDLPLQHASDPVLKRMKRPGTRASYERLLTNIRARIPDVTLRTTFIAGFPGETEADVDALVDFISAIGFDHLGVFTYSHEEGTSAFALPDDVPPEVKDVRQARIMEAQKALVARRQHGRVGQQTAIMVDGPSPAHEWVWRGRLAGQAPEIDPVVYLTDADPELLVPGRLLDVEIVGADEYDLVARPLAGR